MAEPQGLDWAALLQLGLRGLGLRPADFWALTPHELRLMAGLGVCAGPMGRDGLEALRALYPDATDAEPEKGCTDGR
ncbi:rcc01693 family protein [Pseudoruegeria sp. SHC-113]|uniref:rcc01693 family protein n=1 Tax=Pseudoruegeria sp. SHC-113 TaxID=2855439 RepID=UPI0021BA9474|nr:rcc01693 family protein [Pseudoruegeria sp. SHC-113]MCT8160124.1 phage tail assembly chaperone [Pseudoruegeria sp. SHC-113]